MGIISYLACKDGRGKGISEHALQGEDEKVTKADASALLAYLRVPTAVGQAPQQPVALSDAPVNMVQVYRLLARVQPYIIAAPGTVPYFKKKAAELMAMLYSPAVTGNGVWRWFRTESQPDRYLSTIYDNAVTSTMPANLDVSLVERRRLSDALTSSQRATILRDHPALSSRIHYLQQALMYEHVLCGKDKPLGTISDRFSRLEFQRRGSPHTHNLYAVLKDHITAECISSADAGRRQCVLDLVSKTTTALLRERTIHDNSELHDENQRDRELHPDYRIERANFFSGK